MVASQNKQIRHYSLRQTISHISVRCTLYVLQLQLTFGRKIAHTYEAV